MNPLSKNHFFFQELQFWGLFLIFCFSLREWLTNFLEGRGCSGTYNNLLGRPFQFPLFCCNFCWGGINRRIVNWKFARFTLTQWPVLPISFDWGVGVWEGLRHPLRSHHLRLQTTDQWVIGGESPALVDSAASGRTHPWQWWSNE